MEEVKNRFEEILCHGLMFVLHLALVLGGLGFASVFAVAMLGGGFVMVDPSVRRLCVRLHVG